MSEENVERLRAVYAEWAKGKFRAGQELLTPGTRFESGAPGERPVVGAEAIEAQMREFLAQWSEFRVESEAFEDFGEAVLVTERQHGVGKGSGVETEQTFYCVWSFRNGSVVSVRWHTSRKDALQAAGLSE